ncbi:hypothetical protein [Devosia ginsengisoli]|uniref:hypothetical protein n=1 Tax=Devosia ginsengisoli TaxID=400770 RepID=UPI0026F2BB50|nr:hypothetical protein [Devosia ginsengisoli]MCR6673993.1 hypothetical protein [Devosia ginsengisoli]
MLLITQTKLLSSIARRAGAAVSAVSYHFGSVEQLIFSVAERVYMKLNAEAAGNAAGGGTARIRHLQAVEDLIVARSARPSAGASIEHPAITCCDT